MNPTLLALAVALFAASATGQFAAGSTSLCYKIKWNLGTTNVKETVVKPVTAFPKEHALVTRGYCGGKNEGDPIPHNALWSTSGRTNPAQCSSVTGGQAFYVRPVSVLVLY